MTSILFALRNLLGIATAEPIDEFAWLDGVDPATSAACAERIYAPCNSCGSRRNLVFTCRCGS